MLIGKIGEFGLIERFRKGIKLDSSVVKGSGDDCAVIKFTKNKYLLFTCDMLVQGVDFLSQEDPYLIARKSLAVSLSDIAACSGIPRYCLVALAMPKNTSLRFADKFSRGLRDISKEFKLNIVGGDLSRARHITIDVSMLGEVEKDRLALRSGAKKGDIIFVTGSLGGSIKGKHLHFTPRLKEARILTRDFKPSAMIDISDGLTQDLRHILEESQKGAVIYEGLIPQSRQSRDLNDALYSGEDFELLFSLPRRQAVKLMTRKDPMFTAIGEILDKKYGLRLVTKTGKEKPLLFKGFRHF